MFPVDQMSESEVLRLASFCEIGLAKQGVHEVVEFDRRLYEECFGFLRREDGSVLRGGQFMPVLERCGAVSVFDQRMLHAVLEDLDRSPLSVSGCNISAENLFIQAHWDFLYTTIRMHAKLAPRLVIEFTETTPCADLKLAARRLQSLRELGCRIAMDDFGAATPKVLLEADFDIIKIDGGFVADMRGAGNDSNSLQRIVALANRFCPYVVVEGVETFDQHEQAIDAGASHVQGFLFSTPSQGNSSTANGHVTLFC